MERRKKSLQHLTDRINRGWYKKLFSNGERNIKTNPNRKG